MSKFTYRVERNDSFYAVICEDGTEDGTLVINGNLYDYAFVEMDERGLSEKAWILEHHADTIAEFEKTGFTIWDRHNDGLRNGWDVVYGKGTVLSHHHTQQAAERAAKDETDIAVFGELRVVSRASHQAAAIPHHFSTNGTHN